LTVENKIREWAASLSAILLVATVAGLALAGRDIPPTMAGLAGMAFTWLFLRSTQQAEHDHADTVAERLAAKEKI